MPLIRADQLRARAETPTAAARLLEDGSRATECVPDFAHRSYTFHSAHPLEHLESFSDGRFPIDEARWANEWIVKNREDLLRGPGRGTAPEADAALRDTKLEALRIELGMRCPRHRVRGPE